MTLNLRIVLAIIGVIVVILIYLISRWQNRMRRPRRTPVSPEGNSRVRDFPRDESVMGGPVSLRHRREIPVLERPPHSAEGYADQGNDNEWAPPDELEELDDPAQPGAGAFETIPETTSETVPETAPAPPETAPAPARTPEETPVTPAPDWPEPPARDARTPVFTPAAEQESADPATYPVEGFTRLSQIDYWVRITGGRDVGRETVIALYRDGVTGLRKAHGIHGIKEPDREWRNVESESEDSRFTDLVVTIQLADRNGPINELEMAGFSRLVSRLSEGTGREFVFMAPVENAFAQANAIAEFVRRFSSVFAVNVRPLEGAPFNGADIDRYALQIGLERDQGRCYSRFKSVGGGKVALYSLVDQSDRGHFDFDNMKLFSTGGLTFFTRPAANRLPGAVFTEMVDAAKVFAARIDGVVNLSDHEDLSQDKVDATRKSIEQMAAEMERLGIAAGGDEAVRIF